MTEFSKYDPLPQPPRRRERWLVRGAVAAVLVALAVLALRGSLWP